MKKNKVNSMLASILILKDKKNSIEKFRRGKNWKGYNRELENKKRKSEKALMIIIVLI